jgi:hypothetical protein
MATATATTVAKTGNVELDALLSNTKKWGGAVGTGTTLTYSFHTPGVSTYGTQASYGGPAPFDNPTGLSEGLKGEVRSALAEWAKVGNIKFVEVTDTGATSGVMRFGISNDVDKNGSAAYATTLWSNYESAGDVWLSPIHFSGVNSTPSERNPPTGAGSPGNWAGDPMAATTGLIQEAIVENLKNQEQYQVFSPMLSKYSCFAD